MSEAAISVRRLVGAEAPLYRTIRLEALATAPEAFGSTHAAEAARPDTEFAERLEQAAVFVAFRGETMLGMAGFFRHRGLKDAHKGGLWGMYVSPAARGAGVGAALVRAVLAHAAAEVEQVQLTVVSGNVGARRLYERFGFVEYGLERRALKHDGVYVDEVLMACHLN